MKLEASRVQTPANGDDLESRLSGLIRRLTDPLRPAGYDSPREAFQLRFFLGACILGIIVGLLSLVSAVLSDERISIFIIAGFVVFLGLHLFAARFGAPAKWLMMSLLGCVAVFLVVAALATPEIEPSQLSWLILIPLSARAFAAPRVEDEDSRPTSRFTLYAALLSVVAAIVIVVLHVFGITFNQPWQREPAWATATNYPMFLASVMGLLYLYDSSQKAMMDELVRVRRMLSICAWCRKIKSGDEWLTLEDFTTQKTRSDLSHGICPTCSQREFSHISKKS